MAHVQINGSRIFVDGTELTGSVLAEGRAAAAGNRHKGRS